MHQYSTQQLAKLIPRPVRQWTKQDVLSWIALNQVEIEEHLFENHQLNGNILLSIHPRDLMDNFGLTKFIAKQIVEWMEEESEQFDQYVLNPNESHGEEIERQSIGIQKKKQAKEQFAIKSLQENEGEDNCKKQEEVNDVTERVEVGKWGRKKDIKQNIPRLNIHMPEKQKNLASFKNPYVKFASSEFISVESVNEARSLEKRLKLVGEDESFIISNHCKIGRLRENQVVISQESVSRCHAEINCLATSKGDFRYYIKDLKSKFGTFIGCKSTQTNLEGCEFLLEDSEIKILKIEMGKPSPTNRQRTFDITVKMEEKQIKVSNKATLIIGSKKNADIKCEAGSIKIWVDKEKKICLDIVEGKLYKKLKQFEQWDLEAQMDGNKKVDLCFGTYKCTIESISFCANCNKDSKNCEC